MYKYYNNTVGIKKGNYATKNNRLQCVLHMYYTKLQMLATTQNCRSYYTKLHYTTDKTTCTRSTHKLSKLQTKPTQ